MYSYPVGHARTPFEPGVIPADNTVDHFRRCRSEAYTRAKTPLIIFYYGISHRQFAALVVYPAAPSSFIISQDALAYRKFIVPTVNTASIIGRYSIFVYLGSTFFGIGY